MPVSANWVPMRWPAGPLDAGRPEEKAPLSAQAKEALEAWRNPAALEFLRGSPINCLMVNWAAGGPRDSAQQQALAPLIRSARSAGLEVVGMAEPAADLSAARAAAQAAGLSDVLPCLDREKIDWRSPSPVLLVRDNVWPGIQRRARDQAVAAATGGPWIDSNDWFLQLARARSRSANCWLLAAPPAGTIVRTEAYLRALADIHQAGGNWVISLDDSLRVGLARRDAAALETFRAIGAARTFFQKHAHWNSLSPVGVVGVISDFAGDNEFLSTEILNLLARRNIPFRIILKEHASAAPIDTFKALIFMDEQPAPPALRTRLLAFASGGGLLMTGQKWDRAGSEPSSYEYPRFEIRRAGKGRIAIAAGDSPDPYEVAGDCRILLSRVHDIVRYFNISAMTTVYTVSGGRALLQIVNYSQRVPGDLVTVWFRELYRSARLWTPGSEKSEPLVMSPENGGVEVRLPGISTYCAVELDRG